MVKDVVTIKSAIINKFVIDKSVLLNNGLHIKLNTSCFKKVTCSFGKRLKPYIFTGNSIDNNFVVIDKTDKNLKDDDCYIQNTFEVKGIITNRKDETCLFSMVEKRSKEPFVMSIPYEKSFRPKEIDEIGLQANLQTINNINTLDSINIIDVKYIEKEKK